MPATKADVFSSRALSGSDKRSLMRFLSACTSAEQGQGHLKVSASPPTRASVSQTRLRTSSINVVSVRHKHADAVWLHARSVHA